MALVELGHFLQEVQQATAPGTMAAPTLSFPVTLAAARSITAKSVVGTRCFNMDDPFAKDFKQRPWATFYDGIKSIDETLAKLLGKLVSAMHDYYQSNKSVDKLNAIDKITGELEGKAEAKVALPIVGLTAEEHGKATMESATTRDKFYETFGGEHNWTKVDGAWVPNTVAARNVTMAEVNEHQSVEKFLVKAPKIVSRTTASVSSPSVNLACPDSCPSACPDGYCSKVTGSLASGRYVVGDNGRLNHHQKSRWVKIENFPPNALVNVSVSGVIDQDCRIGRNPWSFWYNVVMHGGINGPVQVGMEGMHQSPEYKNLQTTFQADAQGSVSFMIECERSTCDSAPGPTCVLSGTTLEATVVTTH
jgi:hypothetical protein